jgi:hypothetical protein
LQIELENKQNLGPQRSRKKKLHMFYLKKWFANVCPTFKEFDFADKLEKYHGNLGCHEPRMKKPFEYLPFEKVRLPPNLQKLDFAGKIVKPDGNLVRLESRTPKIE